MTIAKKFIIAKHFEGEPKPSDLILVEEELPAIKNGEILLEAEYLSVDPYMRPYSINYPIGSDMIGGQIAKIIESNDPKFPVGKRLRGYYGWRTHTIINPSNWESSDFLTEKPKVLPNFEHLSPSLGLGVLGMPGDTAYFGFLEICKPKAGETLVVSGAAGAIGSHVGQIGKILGLNVIGIAGSAEKCNWLVEDLGFDHAINYKTQDVSKTLVKAASNGVDCYFDNVGGDISSAVIYQMNTFGRISVCGSISCYNHTSNNQWRTEGGSLGIRTPSRTLSSALSESFPDETSRCVTTNNEENFPKAKVLQPRILLKQLKMEGFIVLRWVDRYDESFAQNMKWIREEKLKYRETITEGFENMFNAFAGMLKGENIGKAIVKV